jgi:3-oxoacyl-[acyl-carrier-protein] synthase III
MFFKGGIPVTNKTIEERIGVRKRIVAPEDERIGLIAMRALLDASRIDPSNIKLIVAATNIGDDKYDPGPLSSHHLELVRHRCKDAIVLDLYAGCPGFNVSAELVFVLSLAGILKENDLSVIVAAENIHRAGTFRPMDTANIIFGDDAMATALETQADENPTRGQLSRERIEFKANGDPVAIIAQKLHELNGHGRIDGIIIDNQTGSLPYKVPATAARVQHALVELMYPDETSKGTFNRFKDALAFYDRNVRSFAFDIMTLGENPALVDRIARAYVESGKYDTIVSAYLTADMDVELCLHKGRNHFFEKPGFGIVDTHTQTHGCFADYIQVLPEQGEVFAEINGKGVFLHATRSARRHLKDILYRNQMTLEDIDLYIAHQANFAMIPMTLERVFSYPKPELREAVREFIATRMITNIHVRGNCSVVCMPRLAYDLEQGALRGDNIQGYPVNQNLDVLRFAKTILRDSVGAGMTRSSVLQIRKPQE